MRGREEVGENLSLGFLSLKPSLTHFFRFILGFRFLVDLRVVLEQILFVLKRFRCCTSEIQISLLFIQNLKLKFEFFSHSLSLDFFLHSLTCCLIGDDWNPVMEH